MKITHIPKQIYAPKLQLRYDDYVATFYKQTKNNRWRKFEFVGNTGVAFQIGDMLRRLGFTIELVSDPVNMDRLYD